VKLLELTDLWRQIEVELDANGGEVTEDMEARLSLFNLEERDKVDGYVHIIKDLRARAKLMREQAADLTARARTREANADWLENRLTFHMGERGLRRLEGNTHYAQWQKNGGVPPVELLDGITPDRVVSYFHKRRPVELDEAAIRAALSDENHDFHRLAKDYARLGDRGEHLRLY
jgi:hypothetical protein